MREKLKTLVDKIRNDLKKEEDVLPLKKTFLWRYTISSNRKYIQNLLKNGVKKRRIYEIFREHIEREFGKDMVVSEKLFYALIKEELEAKSGAGTKARRKSLEEKVKIQKSGEEKERGEEKETKEKWDKSIEDFNEGGIL